MRRNDSSSRCDSSSRSRINVSAAPNSAMANKFHPNTADQSGGKLPPPQKTGCGCCVRHHLMENTTIGTSMKQKIEYTAANVARCVGSSIECRSIRYDAYS